MAPHEVDGRVPLQWVCATIPEGDDYKQLDDLDSPTALEELKQVALNSKPIWLELGFPEHTEIRSRLAEPKLDDAGIWAKQAQDWLQGSLEAWVSMPVPIVDWSAVAPVLKAMGLTAPDTPTKRTADAEVRFLEALPHLYGRGVARTQKELDRNGGTSLATMHMFPTVGFLREPEPDGSGSPAAADDDPTPEFWTVRASVGVIRKVVISVRLPDALCSGERSLPEYRTGVTHLTVRRRYLPFGRDANEQDMAEGIGIYQAATLQAVVELIRDRLVAFEAASRPARNETESEEDAARDLTARELEPLLEGVVTLTETAHQLDRHVASVLRRFGAYGERDGERGPVPNDIRLRYGFAIDQLTSLREELRLARSALGDRISAAEQKGREQFQGFAAVIASAILAPGLLAAVYSTDVKLPAEETWPGFVMLVLIIIGLAIIGLWTVTKLQPNADVVRINPAIQRRMPTAAIGAVAAGIGVAIVWPML